MAAVWPPVRQTNPAFIGGMSRIGTNVTPGLTEVVRERTDRGVHDLVAGDHGQQLGGRWRADVPAQNTTAA